MDRAMRQWHHLLLVLCFVGSSSLLLVSSQTTSDSCTAALSLGNLISFNTTGLNCFQAWSSQGFILRFGKDASSAGSNSVWNFVLSAPDSGGYIAVGFSPNGKMVGGSAVAGWATPGAAGTARQYYLGGTTSSLCPPDQGKLSLSRGAAAPTIVSKGSRLYLAFQLSGQPLTNVIYAVGPAGTLPGPSGLLAQHKDMAAGTISLSGGTSGGGGSGTPATGGGGDGDEGHEDHEGGGEGKGKSDQSGGVGGESGSDGNGGRSTTTTASASSSGSASGRVFCAQWTKCSLVVQMLVYFVLLSGTNMEFVD
uniref:DOMON domain-containing protein n=1 Tax=Oryza rufipogon TaxID=4529 RepID=A0A0E0N659_ORYRU